jgi:tetratricopeptide (TPR) repeat protein
MRELQIFQIVLPNRVRRSLAYVRKKQRRAGNNRYLATLCLILTPIIMCSCSTFTDRLQAKSSFAQANDFFISGDYLASLNEYEQIIQEYPTAEDRSLFEMGIIHAHPKNEQKDFQKALECFERIARKYPESSYRQDSEMMIFYINNVTIKDNLITTQQTQIETLREEVRSKENEISALQDEVTTLQKTIEALEQKVFSYAIQKGPADKVLIEKKERRLTLISKGEVLKTYKIALGGNPEDPKERQGDHKTPEGSYFIDARNKNSDYHLSLHISYPNEGDKQRAKELGVSPGGDIMIHGIKNGFSWVGDAHTEADWTKGCIAVTDEEIEEIEKLVPNGTLVEIRP